MTESGQPEPTKPVGPRKLNLGSTDAVLTPLPQPPPAGFSLSGFELPASLTFQNLSADLLLQSVPRLTLSGKSIPAMGGIPLLTKLGQGGMGAVYLGFHPRLRKEVAVKVLPLHAGALEPGMIERFVREAQLAAQVQSPHLVGVLDVNNENGLFYIVMEYVQGETAHEHLKKSKKAGRIGLDECIALDICIATCEGLIEAHNSGIVHRDVKPDNILIPKSKNAETLLFHAAKLADLGLARNEQSRKTLTGNQSGMGTPGFMAPEQAVNAQNAGKPADVFSLGATLYALLAGRAPFAEGEVVEIIMATIQDPHSPVTRWRPDVTYPTSVMLDRCLMKQPDRRFPDGIALLEALKGCRSVVSASDAARQEVTKKLVRSTPSPEASLNPTLMTVPSTVLAPKPGYGLPGKLVKFVGNRVRQAIQQRRYAAAMTEGQMALEKKCWSDAETAFRAALEQRTNDMAALKGVADAIAGSAETRFSSFFAEAKVALDGKNWELAKLAYQRALAEKPDNTAARAGHVQAQYAAAMEEAQRELAGQSEDAEGRYSSVLGDKRRRIEISISRALSLKENDAQALALKIKLGCPRELSLDLGEGVFLELVLVKAGEFEMGSMEGGVNDKLPHRVRFSKPFYIAKFPVTVAQFRRFILSSVYVTDAERSGRGWRILGKDWTEVSGTTWKNPGFPQRDDHPAVVLSWNDAMAFLSWLTKNAPTSWQSQQENLAIVLPSESQWEYAARGPGGFRYPWGNRWEAQKANHADSALKYKNVSLATSMDNDGYAFTAPVGCFQNESWCGAYDLAGNVWEWCQDWFADDIYAASASLDPTGPASGAERVLRGGSWLDMPIKCRSYCRHSAAPKSGAANVGIRIAVTLP